MDFNALGSLAARTAWANLESSGASSPEHLWPSRGRPDRGGLPREDYLPLGFNDIANHRPCFWHPELKALIVVYVDDIEVAGPEKCCKEMWRRLREKVILYFGRPHTAGQVPRLLPQPIRNECRERFSYLGGGPLEHESGRHGGNSICRTREGSEGPGLLPRHGAAPQGACAHLLSEDQHQQRPVTLCCYTNRGRDKGASMLG